MWKANAILGREFVMRRIFLILTLVLSLAPATALADGLSVMVGAESVSFGADLGEYYDIPIGPGVVAIVSIPYLFFGAPLDITVGQMIADEGNSGLEATYQWIEAGPRFIYGNEDDTIRPDIFAGVGSYDLEIGDFAFDTATGGYLGFGFTDKPSKHFTGRLQFKGVYWKSDTGLTDAASLNISLLFGYSY